MAAGLGLSVVFTGDHPLDSGQAWTIITGLDYGSLNGALWAGGLDLQATGVVGTALATGLVGGGVGLLVASKVHPRQGHVELVRSGLLWGTAGGLLGMAAVSTDGSSQSYLRGAGVAMDLGFLGGLALAVSFDLSRNRVLVIDAGAVGGGLAGMGIAWLVVAGPGASPRAIFASGLGGMCTGLAAAAYLSRHMDARDAAAGPDTAALLGRDARGRWAWGTPGPVPVLDRFSQRVVGATFTALACAF
jgi:hypothetical protein